MDQDRTSVAAQALVVAACFVLQALTIGAKNVFGVVLINLEEEFGTDHTISSLVGSVQTCLLYLTGQFKDYLPNSFRFWRVIFRYYWIYYIFSFHRSIRRAYHFKIWLASSGNYRLDRKCHRICGQCVRTKPVLPVFHLRRLNRYIIMNSFFILMTENYFCFQDLVMVSCTSYR